MVHRLAEIADAEDAKDCRDPHGYDNNLIEYVFEVKGSSPFELNL